MVKKIYLFCCIIVMILLFAGGSKRLTSAYNYGKEAGHDFVIQQNGVSGEAYEQIVSLTTKSYQISGGIIASIGGIGIIVFSYALSKELFSGKSNL